MIQSVCPQAISGKPQCGGQGEVAQRLGAGDAEPGPGVSDDDWGWKVLCLRATQALLPPWAFPSGSPALHSA